jgi:long-chain fatty acid transport protein
MKTNSLRQAPLAVAIGIVFGTAVNHALGAGFALQEQNGSGLGQAYAGGAASAEDVSSIYFNPAGLGRLTGTQISGGGNLICPSFKLHDDASQPAQFQSLGGTGGDGGSCGVVPNMYVGVPFGDQSLVFGLGINGPFGLKTEYDSNWLGRFQAVKSKVEAYNVNPMIAWTPRNVPVTFGAGINWQRVKATLTNRVNYAAAFAQAVGTGVAAGQIPAAAAPTLVGAAAGLESDVELNGNDSAWGWNVGALWQINKQTRIGASYRAAIKYTVSGSVNFSNPTALGTLPATLAPVGAALANAVNGVLSSGDVSLALKVPDSANLSVFSSLSDQWDVMADIQYTGWSSFNQLQVVRSSGVVLSTTPENFRDTWRFSVGTNYHWKNWTFKGGLAYDQSPVRDAERTPRLPDSDRTWLALGAQYKFSDKFWLDAGYAHIFLKDASINQNEGNTAANGLINGSYRNDGNVIGLQLTYQLN